LFIRDLEIVPGEIRMSRATGSRGLAVARRCTARSRSALCALLAACSGTTGAAGSPGATGSTGPTGPTTTGTAVNISTATAITGKITSVAIGGPPVVKFQLTDQNGALVQGLPARIMGLR
jgi:hypothetical protein